MSLYTTVLHDVIKKHVCCNLIPTPANTTTPLLRPKYFGRTVVVLTGFHCNRGSLIERGAYFIFHSNGGAYLRGELNRENTVHS